MGPRLRGDDDLWNGHSRARLSPPRKRGRESTGTVPTLGPTIPIHVRATREISQPSWSDGSTSRLTNLD